MYFRPTVVKIYRSPASVFGKLRIVRFVEICPVKFAQALIVFAEMTRNPIHDNAQPVLMRGIDEITEIIRLTVTTCGGIITGGLITP